MAAAQLVDWCMSVLSQLVRSAVTRSSGLRVAVRSRPAQWTIQTARGALVVHPALGFVVSQIRPSRVGTYRLDESRLWVSLRHRTRDVAILNEIFGSTGGINCYAPPFEVAALLGSADPPRIMDLGANIGLFGLYVLGRWPTARITAFEPDPDNASLLQLNVVSNNFEECWHFHRSACSNSCGTVAFSAGLLSEARIAEPGETGTIEVPVVDIFSMEHDVDLLKIDIEGAEWAILTDPRLRELKAASIVLEWHSRGCPEPDPHAAAVRLLRAAGYERTRDVGDHPDHHHNGVVWAWRPTKAARA